MNREADYYENRSLWEPSLFLTKEQTGRFSDVISMIPEDVVTLLDIGCGNGVFINKINDSKRYYDAVGLDRSKVALHTARKHFGVTVISGNIAAIPFNDGSFHIVTSLETLEHLLWSDYKAALSEMERVSSRYILVNVPFNEKRVFYKCPNCGSRFPASFHLRSYGMENLESLFRGARLLKTKKTFISYMSLPEYMLWLMNNRLNPFGPDSLCPVCGFRRQAIAKMSLFANPAWLAVKRIICHPVFKSVFKIKLTEEVICLYQKAE